MRQARIVLALANTIAVVTQLEFSAVTHSLGLIVLQLSLYNFEAIKRFFCRFFSCQVLEGTNYDSLEVNCSRPIFKVKC